MDSIWTQVNTVVCCLLALATSWACLSRRVHDGLVIKLGLILLALGFSGHAWITHDGIDAYDAVALTRAQLLINAGMALAVIGWLLRGRSGRKGHPPERRTSDFVDLDVSRGDRP
jgi:hypothetical protein